MIYFLAKRALNKSRCFITIIIITNNSLARDIFFGFFPKINLFAIKAIHEIKRFVAILACNFFSGNWGAIPIPTFFAKWTKIYIISSITIFHKAINFFPHF
jgi:hypothetical protein